MSSDIELLELAAKAYGIEHQGFSEGNGLACGMRFWNPLANDGDALRLAIKLRLHINWGDGTSGEFVFTDTEYSTYDIEEYIEPDACAAVRRAIVRAAAEIGYATP